MDPRQLSVDRRLVGICVFCGGPPDTRDHVPSKVFLDDPLPDDLPVVEACATCNQGFSLDEEYLACFLEAVVSGSANPQKMTRKKITEALSRNPGLASRLQRNVRSDPDGTKVWTPEYERVRNVVVKLARGHAAYELSLPQFDDPSEVSCLPLLAMSKQQRTAFESVGSEGLQAWPEIGSRASIRACGAEPYADTPGSWIDVQPDRYRYAVSEDDGVLVRIVLVDYLACQVRWE